MAQDASTPRPNSRHRVLIAGGGVAALEALLALGSMAGHRLDLTVLSAKREFRYGPVSVAEAFEQGESRVYPLGEIVEDQGAELVWDSLAEIHPDAHAVTTGVGDRLEYDTLIVATGAVPVEPLPGALTFRGHQDVPALREMLTELIDRGTGAVAFTLPSETTWSLPLYELALMTAAHLREADADDVEVVVVTPEEEPLGLFGHAASEAIRDMLRLRSVSLRTRSLATAVHRHALELAGGGRVFADRVVTLPLLEGPSLPGLPHDNAGFIPVDAHGRVHEVSDVYAAGDVTTLPLKQGGLAAQQADAVAEAVAAELGLPITPQPFRPILRGLLMSGGAPLYLRAEPHREPTALGASETNAGPSRDKGRRDLSVATGQPLWWPPAKIAGRYLAPYLATARPNPLSTGLLMDRAPLPGGGPGEDEYRDAQDLALILARSDAGHGDYRSALRALEAAEALHGALPPEYEAKRRSWLAALQREH